MKHLLILVLISLTLGACSSQHANNVTVATQYQPNTSATAMVINSYKSAYYTIPKVAQAEYNRCVEFALRSMQVGEQCKWEVPGNSVGIVKLVQIDATGCHYLFNTIMYRGKHKNFQETACYSNASKKWRFQ
jgi:hypothetical protein